MQLFIQVSGASLPGENKLTQNSLIIENESLIEVNGQELNFLTVLAIQINWKVADLRILYPLVN